MEHDPEVPVGTLATASTTRNLGAAGCERGCAATCQTVVGINGAVRPTLAKGLARIIATPSDLGWSGWIASGASRFDGSTGGASWSG
jgi:hypothetical protein